MTASETSTRPARDFPYYDGRPVALSWPGWLVVLALTAAGFMSLVYANGLVPGPLGRWLAVGGFVALPLLGLRLAAGAHWAALFRRPTLKEVWIGLAFAPLTLLASAIVAVGVMRLGLTAANPAAAIIVQLRGLDLVLFLASTAPQLLGEELVTAIPFLALLTLGVNAMKLSRRNAIILAWIGSAVLFGALHLSTYQWHLGQVLLIIGTARLVLTLPFLITKNLWVSTIAHLTNDWIIFAVVIVASAFKAG